jgi:hypothetical protein
MILEFKIIIQNVILTSLIAPIDGFKPKNHRESGSVVERSSTYGRTEHDRPVLQAFKGYYFITLQAKREIGAIGD